MYEKGGKYYADWRDKSGQRKRKSFISGRAALRFEAEQKELAHPKPKARATTSHRCYAPTSKGAARKIVPFPTQGKRSSK